MSFFIYLPLPPAFWRHRKSKWVIRSKLSLNWKRLLHGKFLVYWFPNNKPLFTTLVPLFTIQLWKSTNSFLNKFLNFTGNNWKMTSEAYARICASRLQRHTFCSKHTFLNAYPILNGLKNVSFLLLSCFKLSTTRLFLLLKCLFTVNFQSINCFTVFKYPQGLFCSVFKDSNTYALDQ